MPDEDSSIYKKSFQNIDVPTLIADKNFVIQDINSAGLDFTGYGRNEVIGQSVAIVAGDEEGYSEIIDTVINNEVWSGEFQLQTKEGRIVYGRGSAAPIFLNGEKKGYVAIFIDTTKQRQYRNTSEVLNRLLRHDMRNDMNALYGSIQIALTHVDEENEVATDKLEAALDMISAVISRTERARDISTLLEEQYDVENRPVPLDHVLNDVIVDTLEEFEQAEFHFNEIPAISVYADDLLATVLETIIENAVHHNDEETPIVTITVEESDSEVIVSIADNGPGVPDAKADLIFGREEQGPLHHGSGISLFFADNVVDSYEGDLWVEDNDPEGAIFKCRLNKV